MTTEVIRRGAPVTRARVSYIGDGMIRINRVAAEGLSGRYVSMRVRDGVVLLRSRESIPVRGGDDELLYGTLTPVGAGLLNLRVGHLIRRYHLTAEHTFAVIPDVKPGEVSFTWPLEV